MQIKILPVKASLKETELSLFLINIDQTQGLTEGLEIRKELAKLIDQLPDKLTAGDSHVFWQQKIGVIGVNCSDSVVRQNEWVRRGIAQVISQVRAFGIQKLTIDLSGWKSEDGARVVAESLWLSHYTFTQFSNKARKEHENQRIKEVGIYVPEDKVSADRKKVKEAEKVIKTVAEVRDLVNLPANEMSPKKLVQVAREMGKKYTNIKVQIWDKTRIKKEKMRAFLAVSQGSAEAPYVIRLSYKPKGAQVKLAVVGKGITFDSGGLSIKPADYMHAMKMDMAGAAAVIGLFKILGEMGALIEVQGYIAACENMPSGTAYRPGDVIKSRSGKTIEIKDTDAEGRVTLADMLDVAVSDHPDAIIDIATLTGACMVGLGESVAGMMGNDSGLMERVVKASEQTGEQVATLPLPLEYRKDIESKVADICNLSAVAYGGALTAGLFLQEFVKEKPWVHLDIAGPAYMERATLIPYYTEGATGFGTRLLWEVVRRWRK